MTAQRYGGAFPVPPQGFCCHTVRMTFLFSPPRNKGIPCGALLSAPITRLAFRILAKLHQRLRWLACSGRLPLGRFMQKYHFRRCCAMHKAVRDGFSGSHRQRHVFHGTVFSIVKVQALPENTPHIYCQFFPLLATPFCKFI